MTQSDRSDFQQRELEEKRELDIKLGKLGAFLGGEIFQTLTNEERLRLRQQAAVMKTYSEILGQRIEAWS